MPPPPPPGKGVSADRSAFLSALGPDRGTWNTLQPDRLVVAVTRNETTTATLVSNASSIFVDPRVQVVFAIAPDRSAFSMDLETSLRARGLLVAPWAQLQELSVDLVLAASYAGAPLALKAPVLFVPHGYGRTRDLVAQEPARPGDLVGNHRVVHAAPHENAAKFLPSWGEIAVVGDPILDSLINSRSQAASTRATLAVHAAQKLLVVTSTWRRNSLFASRPDIFEQLLSDLPADDYVVAAILHPNIWVGHGRWQTRTWLQPALDAGLRLIPFDQGWRPTLASADLVLGDHGSVTFYADLLGKPVLRAYNSLEELTPGTVLADRVANSPHLNPHDRLRPQLEQLEPPSQESTSALLDASVRHIGQAHHRLRDLAYELMDRVPPAVPARSHRSALPETGWTEPACHWAALLPTRPTAGEASDPQAHSASIDGGLVSSFVLERTTVAPATTPADTPSPPLAPVMVARLDAALAPDAQRASVLLLGTPGHPDRAAGRSSTVEELRVMLHQFPGALCTVGPLGPSVLVLHHTSADPIEITVAGLSADDTRAMTSAALLVLERPGSISLGHRQDHHAASMSAVLVRSATTTWLLTPDPSG